MCSARQRISNASAYRNSSHVECFRRFGGEVPVSDEARADILTGKVQETDTEARGENTMANTTPQVTILGIPIHNISMAEALDTILEWLQDEQTRQVCFVNADCANISCKDTGYLEVLKKADLCLADGMGLHLAGKMLNQPIVDNVNGTDMFPLLCERLSKTDTRLYLLGALPGVADEVVEWIGARFPQLVICGTRHGYFQPDEEQEIIQEINASGADLLLVAFGAPKQDVWIHRHAKEMGVKVAIGVGGLFDFYSGRHARAPQWMRNIGIEWMHRLMLEPRRLWKRYLVGNVVFLARVVKEKCIPRTS